MTAADGPVLSSQLFVFVTPWPFVIVGFLIGAIPFGLLVGRFFFKTDIRREGSGNIGAANALRTMGYKAGVAVLLLDALKGAAATVLPLLVVLQFFSHQKTGWARYPNIETLPPVLTVSIGFGLPLSYVCAASGLAAILGHCYSPFLSFRGGKGVATFLGVLIAAGWESALAFVIVWLAVVVPTGLASAGSMLGALVAIVAVAVLRGSATLYFSIPAMVIIVWQHRDNIRRLIAGNENRLDLLRRSSGK